MKIDVIRRADQPRFTEISTLWKKRIKRLQIRIIRIAVAAGYVCFQSNARRPHRIRERESGIACGRPCRDISVAKRAELIDEFKIPIPLRALAPKSRAQ